MNLFSSMLIKVAGGIKIANQLTQLCWGEFPGLSRGLVQKKAEEGDRRAESEGGCVYERMFTEMQSGCPKGDGARSQRM